MPVIHLYNLPEGPIFYVAVQVSVPRRDALIAAGLQPPPGVVAKMLVDTGASGTAMDPACLQPLGLIATGSTQVQTPTTGTGFATCQTYDVSLYLPTPAGAPKIIEALPIIEAVLRPQGIDGLLGRDVLDDCMLVYGSPKGGFTLSF